MLFAKGGSGNNKVVGGNDGGKDGGIVIYSVDDDGGVGECDDEDLRLLESMGSGGAKSKAEEAAPKGAKGTTGHACLLRRADSKALLSAVHSGGCHKGVKTVKGYLNYAILSRRYYPGDTTPPILTVMVGWKRVTKSCTKVNLSRQQTM